ncbi:hypothetical protein Scani_23830 [Streptomyces caniferus]|uniref:Uncharacterized protein n=1 Tax=Streptomyces caniferus TaxID=285557 RepID=A0A640S920_9ACTN|nr:hypothetical protein Scani_23830 [Streptomyces caniferus]
MAAVAVVAAVIVAILATASTVDPAMARERFIGIPPSVECVAWSFAVLDSGRPWMVVPRK